MTNIILHHVVFARKNCTVWKKSPSMLGNAFFKEAIITPEKRGNSAKSYIMMIYFENGLHKVKITGLPEGINLGNVPAYIEGETAWSYVSRLAYANVIDNTDLFLNRVFNKNQKEWGYDCVSPYLFNFLKVEAIENWNYASSLYQFLLPFVPEEKHDARIRGYYTWPKSHTRIVDSFKPQIDSLKVCPECRKRDEENGLFHFHIGHQIPGLTLCPEHKCVLETYTGTHGNEYTSRIFSEVVPSADAEAYAEFCKGLIENPLTTSFKETKMVLKEKITERFGNELLTWNFNNKAIRDFFESFNFSSDVYGMLIRNTTRSEIPVSSLITLLVYFYGPDVEAFRKDCLSVSDVVSDEEFLRRLNSEGYTVLGTYNPFYLTLRFNRPYMRKAEDFTTTKHSMLLGWTTPIQDKASSPDELFSHLFNTASGTENLKLLSTFGGWSNSIAVQDSNLTTLSIPARDFIYSGVRVGSIVFSYEHIINFFSKKPDFTLQEVKMSSNPHIRITHSCGKEMYISYNSFLAAPYCKDCRLTERRVKLEKEILDVSKGKFHLSELSRSFYSATDGKVTISDNTTAGLKTKLSSLTYNAEREVRRITYIEKFEEFLEKLLKKEELKIFNAENYIEYGSLKDIQECMNKFVERGQLLQLSKKIYCERGSVYSASNYCKVLCKPHEKTMIAIPFGESLLEEIGIRTSGNQEYATNLVALLRSGKRIKKIGGNTVTLVSLKTDFNDENWKTLSLLITVDDKEKISTMSKETKEKLALWCKSNEITESKIREQKTLFNENTINRAIALIGA